MRFGDTARRTLGCLGTAVVGMLGAVGALVLIGVVQQMVRPQFDTPVPAIAVATLVVAGGLVTLLALSRRR